MISRLARSISKRVSQWWRKAPINARRGVGVSFDIMCSSILCLVPFVVHGAFDGLQNGDFSNMDFLGWLCSSALNDKPKDEVIRSFLSHHYFALSCLCSPFPLLVMRFVCKCLMKTKTPGELLGQYSNLCPRNSRFSWIRQIAVAFSQYFILLLLLPLIAFSMIPAFWFCLALTMISVGAGWPTLLVIPPFVGFYVISYFFGSLYSPAKEGSLRSGIDKLLGVDVVDLRIGSNSALGPEQAADKLAVQP